VAQRQLSARQRARLKKLGLGAALFGEEAAPEPVEVLEAPRSFRERRLDPATTLTGAASRGPGGSRQRGQTIRLVEAERSRIDPNTTRLFSRPEIRRSLGLPDVPGGIRSPMGVAARVLQQRLQQLRRRGGAVGILASEPRWNLPVFGTGGIPTLRGGRGVPQTRSFPFREVFPTQPTQFDTGSLIRGRSTRSL
jgi:hypothetical protein